MRISSAGVVVAGLLALVASSAQGQLGSTAVNTQWSVFLAGGNAYSNSPAGGSPGIVPPAIALAAGTERVLTVSATGTAAFCGPSVCVAASPDGPAIGATNIHASGSISGIIAPSSGFLSGVFLGPTLPGATPSSLDFVALTTGFSSLSPGLGQVFFIGDGVTSGGESQRFLVPEGATRLFFGIADASSFVGDPGFYGDNVGSYLTEYEISASSVVPEPMTGVLFGTGVLGLGLALRRRNRGIEGASMRL